MHPKVIMKNELYCNVLLNYRHLLETQLKKNSKENVIMFSMIELIFFKIIKINFVVIVFFFFPFIIEIRCVISDDCGTPFVVNIYCLVQYYETKNNQK